MNPYSRLGLPMGAPMEEVRKAYKRLAMVHHPDRGGDPDAFHNVKASYEFLERRASSVGLFDDIIKDIARRAKQ